MDEIILLIYDRLHDFFGSQQWWPMDAIYHENNGSDPRFEIIIGAILTQNTAWSNVEKALHNLKMKNILDLFNMNKQDISSLKMLIKPSGFFNQKANRLKHICNFLLQTYDGDLDQMFARPTNLLRDELLQIKGIGPETADSILLYAGSKPIFVVDAYTKRICNRIPLNVDETCYDEIQHYFQESLEKHHPKDQLSTIYNEYHAFIVELGKQFCKKQKPLCMDCPLESLCNFPKKSK
jgi:endonuclease-3 related protein